jgi:ribosomal-protein-alanine N-acetyltransferase
MTHILPKQIFQPAAIIILVIQVPEFFKTNRLHMRRPMQSDAAAVFEFGRDPEVTRFMDWPTHITIDAAKEYLRDCEPRWDTVQEYDWMIILTETNEIIGGLSLRIRGHAADFGYILNRNFWGRGIATEAAITLVSWADSIPSLYRIWATCDVENLASARVLEKAGLSREGVLRKWAIRPNISPEPRDALVYSKIRE